MEKKDKKIAITGANGFLGSHITELLVEEGYNVKAVIRKSSNLQWIKHLPVNFGYADVTEKESLEKNFEKIDVVIHNAGLVKTKHPEEYFRINTQGTENVVKACVAKKVKKLIYISSQAASGPSSPNRERKEEDPAQPKSLYGKSKLEAEKVLLKYRNKIDIVILRPSAIYGPRDTEMLALFKTYVKGFKIYPGKGKLYLSLVYVKDVANMVKLVIENKVSSGEIFFISDGVVYNLDYIYKVMEEITLKKAVPLTIPLFALPLLTSLFFANSAMTYDKIQDLKYRYWIVSIEKAQKILKFQPQYTLKKGLRETIKWYERKGWI